MKLQEALERMEELPNSLTYTPKDFEEKYPREAYQLTTLLNKFVDDVLALMKDVK